MRNSIVDSLEPRAGKGGPAADLAAAPPLPKGVPGEAVPRAEVRDPARGALRGFALGLLVGAIHGALLGGVVVGLECLIAIGRECGGAARGALTGAGLLGALYAMVGALVGAAVGRRPVNEAAATRAAAGPARPRGATSRAGSPASEGQEGAR